MRIYVDFDGTLFSYGKFPEAGLPAPFAKAFMRKLREGGHHIVIYSTRATRCGINSPQQREVLIDKMVKALVEHDIPFDEIAEDKPPWDILVDDRCIRFKGSFVQVLAELATFDPLDWSKCDGKIDETFHREDGD